MKTQIVGMNFFQKLQPPSTQENNCHVAPVGTFFAGFPNLCVAIL